MIDISIIFKGADIVKRISEYLNLIDSVSSRISKLEKMHQKSARESFANASRTNDSKLQRHYILRAIDKYNDALGIEDDDEARFGIYVGLASCHSILSDVNNRNIAISKALECYKNIRSKSLEEPLDLIGMQSNDDEDVKNILNVVWGVTTLGIGNLANEGIKKISANKIKKYKEKEEEMRFIAKQLSSYVTEELTKTDNYS